MIARSSSVRLNYSNKNKLNNLFSFFGNEIETACVGFINELIYEDDVPKFIPTAVILEKLKIGGRVGQLLAKECSSIARSMSAKIKKSEKLNYRKKYQDEIIKKFQEKSLFVSSLSSLNLDSRFVDIQDATTSVEFDYWIKFSYPNKGVFLLPFKKTRHMVKLEERGYTLKRNTLRINKRGFVEFSYQQPNGTNQNTNTDSIGIDVGRCKSFVCSDGVTENTTNPILNSLKLKKHGSNAKAARVRKMKQEIDLAIKRINFKGIKTIFLENLTGMKSRNKWGNINHHWTYAHIQNRICLHAEEHDVHVKHVDARYTSQTCSACGVIDKESRKGESYSCNSCGHEMDADLNASINIRNKGINSTLSI